MALGLIRARPLVLPRLSRAEADASRVRHAPRAVLTLLNGPLRLWLDGEGPGQFGPALVRVVFHWGESRLHLLCPEGLPAQILRALDADLDLASLPPDLAGLLLEAALLPAITAWEQTSGRGVAIAEIDRTASASASNGLHLVLEDGSLRWPLTVSPDEAPHGASSVLAALMELWPIALPAMVRFGVPATLRIGTTPLSVAAVASLRPDDAVLLRTTLGRDGMLVIAETWTSAARHDGADRWRVLEAPRRGRDLGRTEWTMQDADAADGGPGSEPAADPDELPMHLSFDVGRVELTLGELRRLGPGSVLEIGRSTTELVRISAHGRLIGHGELVEVEGSAAVRIVRLFDHG